MKLLFDQNLSFKLCTMLADLFPDSIQVRQVGLDQASDSEIWEFARANSYSIVTQDADYAELSALFNAPPKVVWLRCGNQPTAIIERLIRGYAEHINTLESEDSVSLLEVL